MNRYPKANKIIRDHEYTQSIFSKDSDYLKKKFKRLEVEARKKAEQEAAATKTKVRPIRKTA